MNYELAKKLKDTGFPQVFPQPDFLGLHDAVVVQKVYDKYPKEFNPYRPTLSELIEACGDYLVDIQRLAENDWKAGGGTIVDGKIGYHREVRSSSPSEAVANLWLELNKKGK